MGAYFRVLGHSWWPEEMPSEEEYAEAEANLERAGWYMDCVLTHCAPTSITKAIDPGYHTDTLTDFLESVSPTVIISPRFFRTGGRRRWSWGSSPYEQSTILIDSLSFPAVLSSKLIPCAVISFIQSDKYSLDIFE